MRAVIPRKKSGKYDCACAHFFVIDFKVCRHRDAVKWFVKHDCRRRTGMVLLTFFLPEEVRSEPW